MCASGLVFFYEKSPCTRARSLYALHAGARVVLIEIFFHFFLPNEICLFVGFCFFFFSPNLLNRSNKLRGELIGVSR